MSTPRVEPLKPSELTEQQRTHVRPFTSPKGHFPNIFGTLLRNVELFEAWSDFGTYTMSGSRIDARLREVLILRTAANLDCEYEWHHHKRLACSIGLSEDLVDRIRNRKALDSEEQDLMVLCANDLAKDTRLSDSTWQRMVDRFGLQYTMDAVFTVGAYTALAMGLKSCDVRVEGKG